VPRDRLQRRQRMCRWISAARHLQLQGRLRVHVRDNSCLHGNDGELFNLCCGNVLHRQRHSAGYLHLCRGGLLSHGKQLYNGINLPCGYVLHRWIGSRGVVHRCGGYVLPCVMRNERGPLSIGLVLHWRGGACCAVRDTNTWVLLRKCKCR
jgi:hypothetical protein